MARKTRKAITCISTVSGVASFLGAYNVCHGLCMAIIAVLAGIGILIVGMPFAWLQPYSIYLWFLAIGLLGLNLLLYKRHCVSQRGVLFNIGVIILAVPFAIPLLLNIAFWLSGAFIIFAAITLNRLPIWKNRAVIPLFLLFVSIIFIELGAFQITDQVVTQGHNEDKSP